jgi:hypothetical protein
MLQPHFSIRATPGWDGPGFYSGDAGNLDDLVTCWNLRAAHIPVLFVDPNHMDRYADVIVSWEKAMRQNNFRATPRNRERPYFVGKTG